MFAAHPPGFRDLSRCVLRNTAIASTAAINTQFEIHAISQDDDAA